ncbi:MAG TPA: RNA polymerase sigma factor RpoH [Gammaproteobacteria bacterium]|nr:RNA polymerase sigma factor RpoH [Gammaproteobacteria bacterium]|tara:strand:- start:42 stop:902 length:861 start_codon:yes stop_codon:yes gene_type:complete
MTSLAQTSSIPVIATGSLQSYLDSIQQIRILERHEEEELFRQFQEQDDLEAARRLVLSHLRYVVYIAKGYSGYGLPVEDLIQQGNVGLMKSVKKFDLQHGVRLVSFAVHWIKAEIHDYILKNWKIVKVATTKAQRKLFFNLRKSKQRLGWFNSEEIKLVAADLGVKPQEVLEMEGRLASTDESYESLAIDDDDYSSGPSSYLTYEEEAGPSDLVEREEYQEFQYAGLKAALAALDDRSRDIVSARWLGEDKLSLKSLAEKYGVSLERIRQIESKALQSMQEFIATD